MTPLENLGKRVRQVRLRRDMTADDVACQMREQGVNWGRATVAKLENGHRTNATVTELLALSVALNVSPVDLLVPLDNKQPYMVTPETEVSAVTARYFVQGFRPLPGSDANTFMAERPQHEAYEYAVGPDELGRQQFHFRRFRHPENFPEGWRDSYRGPSALSEREERKKRRKNSTQEGSDDGRS